MRRRAAIAIGLLAMANGGAAQAVSNRAADYLFQTDVTDARALWLNPAGPAIARNASIYADLVAANLGADSLRLAQVSAGFSSRGLAFGYQYDDLDTGVGHTYRVGAAGAAGALTAGFAAAWYRGGTNAWGYDVGATYVVGRRLVVGASAANIGQPLVRGTRLDFALIPGFTATPLGPALELSALGRFGGSADGYAIGLRWHLPATLRGALLARLDTDDQLELDRFAFGVAIGGQDQVGLVATTPRDVSRVDAASLYGVAIRQFRR